MYIFWKAEPGKEEKFSLFYFLRGWPQKIGHNPISQNFTETLNFVLKILFLISTVCSKRGRCSEWSWFSFMIMFCCHACFSSRSERKEFSSSTSPQHVAIWLPSLWVNAVFSALWAARLWSLAAETKKVLWFNSSRIFFLYIKERLAFRTLGKEPHPAH